MPFRALPRTLWHRTRWDRYKYTNMNRQIHKYKNSNTPNINGVISCS